VRDVRARAPATVSNLACGFDVLGLAITGPADQVVARRSTTRGVTIRSITGDNGSLPRDPERNTAGLAALGTLERAGMDVGVELDIEKGLPIGSGLGSSAASAVAAALAVNRLLGSPLRKPELIAPCLTAEAAVSGRHADNIAPCLLGGLVLVRQVDPLDVVRLPVPRHLHVAVVTPNVRVETRRAREVVPAKVPLSAMVEAGANVGALVAACFSEDLRLLGRALTDSVVTPARAPLIPACTEVMAAALRAGAVGTSISGAGPSMFALCDSERRAQTVARAMAQEFSRAGLDVAVHVSPADCPGARVI
jgi:homoserine kinase